MTPRRKPISLAVRRLVTERANHRCEYCQHHAEFSSDTFDWREHFVWTDDYANSPGSPRPDAQRSLRFA